MSVSLGGYIADPDDYLGGGDGERLHKWADAGAGSAEPSGWTGDGAISQRPANAARLVSSVPSRGPQARAGRLAATRFTSPLGT
jgi:hypothetical protein